MDEKPNETAGDPGNQRQRDNDSNENVVPWTEEVAAHNTHSQRDDKRCPRQHEIHNAFANPVKRNFVVQYLFYS